jgi:hypothetical protein
MKKYNIARTGSTWNLSQLANAPLLMPHDFRDAFNSGDSELEGFATASVSVGTEESRSNASPCRTLE